MTMNVPRVNALLVALLMAASAVNGIIFYRFICDSAGTCFPIERPQRARVIARGKMLGLILICGAGFAFDSSLNDARRIRHPSLR